MTWMKELGTADLSLDWIAFLFLQDGGDLLRAAPGSGQEQNAGRHK